jgi:hypothetical protein
VSGSRIRPARQPVWRARHEVFKGRCANAKCCLAGLQPKFLAKPDYVVHAHWHAQARLGEIKMQIAGLVRVGASNQEQHMLKLIIDASCTADHKTQSRWGQALRYVWRRRKHKHTSRKQFDPLLHCNGEVAGCASGIALAKRRLGDGSRLGFGFDSRAFQKSIDSQKSDALSEIGATL